MIKQARDYDPEGNYIKLWCPELGDLPAGALALFMPWKAPGIAYPSPMILEPEWERQRPAGSRGPRNGGNGGKNKPHARGSDWKVKRFDKSGSGHHD